MKVILQQDVKGQGKRGQLIEASDGYARNFLLPRKLAVEASSDNLHKMQMHDKALKERLAAEKAESQAVATTLEGLLVTLHAKAGTGGRLFGAVTTKEVSDGLKTQHGIDIAKAKILQDDPIKSFGSYQLKCKLGHEVSGVINVLVVEEK